jgi:hypothetical protein
MDLAEKLGSRPKVQGARKDQGVRIETRQVAHKMSRHLPLLGVEGRGIHAGEAVFFFLPLGHVETQRPQGCSRR